MKRKNILTLVKAFNSLKTSQNIFSFIENASKIALPAGVVILFFFFFNLNVFFFFFNNWFWFFFNYFFYFIPHLFISISLPFSGLYNIHQPNFYRMGSMKATLFCINLIQILFFSNIFPMGWWFEESPPLLGNSSSIFNLQSIRLEKLLSIFQILKRRHLEYFSSSSSTLT